MPRENVRPFSELTKDFPPERKAKIKEQSKEIAERMKDLPIDDEILEGWLDDITIERKRKRISTGVKEKFYEWFCELEGFHVREERFWDAVERQDTGELLDWLQCAFELGYEHGKSDSD